MDADLDGDGEVAVGDAVSGLPYHVEYQLRLVDETGADALLLGPALRTAAVEVNALTPPGDSTRDTGDAGSGGRSGAAHQNTVVVYKYKAAEMYYLICCLTSHW